MYQAILHLKAVTLGKREKNAFNKLQFATFSSQNRTFSFHYCQLGVQVYMYWNRLIIGKLLGTFVSKDHTLC